MCLFDDHSLRSGHWHILGTLSEEFARAGPVSLSRGYLKSLLEISQFHCEIQFAPTPGGLTHAMVFLHQPFYQTD